MAAMTPEQIKKTFARARAAQEAGKFDDAVKGYHRILKARPDLAEVHFNLGVIFTKQGRAAEASSAFEQALKAKPLEPAIWLEYLRLASLHPRVENLRTLLKRAAGVKGLGANLTYFQALAAEDPAQSESLLRDAFKSGLKLGRARIRLGELLFKRGATQDALTEYEAAIAIDPMDDLALSKKAELLRNIGETAQAKWMISAAIKANPSEGAHYKTYTSIEKMTADDPMISDMERLLKRKSKSDISLGHLGHALAKAMEDTGQHDKMFRYLNIATTNIRTRFPFDIAVEQDSIATVQTMHEGLVDHLGDFSETPRTVFVTGLPRSGTTLVEQILSSHSDVEGGGELGLLGPQMLPALQQKDATLDARITSLTEVGTAYRSELASLFPGTSVVTDKSITTFTLLGLVATALPDARIIVVRRDPRDNALSIFKNHFEEGKHRYSNDLRDIATFMRLAEDQIAFWRGVRPQSFIEVAYEDIVDDLEPNARTLVSYAGLEWQDACLEFHKNKRRVDTLSSAQVRQKLYSSSVGAWRRHEKEMQPFIDTYLELGGTLPE